MKDSHQEYNQQAVLRFGSARGTWKLGHHKALFRALIAYSQVSEITDVLQLHAQGLNESDRREGLRGILDARSQSLTFTWRNRDVQNLWAGTGHTASVSLS